MHSPTQSWSHDPVAAAKMALSCLDLTSLNDNDSEADIDQLCARAQGPFGPVAAVCVWPRFTALARRLLPAHIAVAAVANFPGGGSDVTLAVRDVKIIVDSGAQEVDVVLPYPSLLGGDADSARRLLDAVRKASDGLVLKVILETGALADPDRIAAACKLSMNAGADFLKTSTGKTPVGATAQAASTILESIVANKASTKPIGFKASGGIRTVADACVYMDVQANMLGLPAVNSRRFRIGASSILGDIETILRGGVAASPTALPSPATLTSSHSY
jgi:deoxyribose-phosphate aldolase